MRFTASEIEWASRLRGAGLAWEPQPGHYVFDIDGVVKAGSPFQAGVYLITSLNAFEAMVGGAEGMHQHFSWLPTWEDAREWLQANDVGDDEYLKFEDERGPMPAGTLIAKESFAVNDAGEVQKGPLFLMQKVEAGVSPETEDWYYMAVAPNGNPMAVDVITACNECHQGNFGYRDGLGYPVPEVRAGQ